MDVLTQEDKPDHDMEVSAKVDKVAKASESEYTGKLLLLK